MFKTNRAGKRAGLAVLSAVALSAASIFGMASAASADYVSPEELAGEVESNWVGYGFESNLAFTECAVVAPEYGAWIEYSFSGDSILQGPNDVSGLIESLFANVTVGTGTLAAEFKNAAGDTVGIRAAAPAGGQLHLGLSSEVDVYDGIPVPNNLGLTSPTTPAAVIAAMGDDIFLSSFALELDAGAEAQWISFGPYGYWFGTDSEWYLDENSPCHPPVDNPETPADPAPAEQPKKPGVVHTGINS